MSHGSSMECPNCGRSIAHGEMYCYFCELDVGKMKGSHAHGRNDHNNPDLDHEISRKNSFFSWLASGFRAKKHAENANSKETSGKQ